MPDVALHIEASLGQPRHLDPGDKSLRAFADQAEGGLCGMRGFELRGELIEPGGLAGVDGQLLWQIRPRGQLRTGRQCSNQQAGNRVLEMVFHSGTGSQFESNSTPSYIEGGRPTAAD